MPITREEFANAKPGDYFVDGNGGKWFVAGDGEEHSFSLPSKMLRHEDDQFSEDFHWLGGKIVDEQMGAQLEFLSPKAHYVPQS